MAVVLFFGALFSFGSRYPGYSHSNRAVSELGAFGAPHAWGWNIVGFIIPGILLAMSGASIALTVDGGRTRLLWLLLISGLAFAGTGVFPAEMHNSDPLMSSLWTSGHIVMLFISGVAWIAGSVVLVRHVGRSTQRRSLKQFSLFLCVMAFAGMAINVTVTAIPALENSPGLAQRIAFALYFAWYLMAASSFVSAPTEPQYSSA